MNAGDLLAGLKGDARTAVLKQLRGKGSADAPKPKKRSKFGAEPVIIDGHRFPSKREANEYTNLCRLRDAGEVRWFCIQPVFLLTGGIKYVADFIVHWRDDTVTVEDSKGFKTPEYKLKRKLMASMGVLIKET